MTRLNPTEKQVLRLGSPEAIADAFPRLNRHLVRGRWLASSNRYGGDGIARIHDDVCKPARQVDSSALAQYVAASTVRHVGDGWSYLGTSLQAACRGEANHSLHLAYYASLHAALAILASQGVAVLNREHFSLSSEGQAKLVSRRLGTHQMAWLALEHWGARLKSGETLGRMIVPGGISLATWLGAGFGGSPWKQIGSRWFGAWDLDLKRFATDRDLRNAASYRPDGLDAKVPTADDTAAFVLDMWTALQPSSYSPFDQLDRHLLRRAIRASYDQTTGDHAFGDGYVRVVDKILSEIGAPPSNPTWREFLLRTEAASDLALLQYAADRGRGPAHFGVVSRAVLLLRIATGIAADVATASAVPPASFEFWWLRLLRDRGLYDGDSRPLNVLDLWLGPEESMRSLAEWRGSPTPRTYARLNSESASNVASLAGFERVVAWGLRF